MINLTWLTFSKNLSQDLKIFLFTWLYLNLLRVVALITMNHYALNINAIDIVSTIYYGAKMSLKTAGILLLFTFLVSLIALISNKNFKKFKLVLASIFFFITNFLFIAKYFYYKEFHTNFDEMIFNALNDDMGALFHTFIEQYHLIAFSIMIIIWTGVLVYLLSVYLKIFNMNFFNTNNKFIRIGIILGFLVFAVFIRFGGSLNYAHSLHWENCAKVQDSFLNEMILDDMQAIYRGYSIKKRIDNGAIYGVDKENIQKQVEFLAHNTDASELNQIDISQIDNNLAYKTQGNIIQQKQHIFIIIGESFAQWPLLEQYANLGLAKHTRAIMQNKHSVYTHNFMPNGPFTPMAVNAMISGLSYVGVYPNHQIESYKQVYKTSFAPQIEKLGYKTEFWYSGFSGWEKIKDFALAQGFDEFHCASDFDYPSGNVWGSDDYYIFQKLQEEIKQNNKPTVYVILTVSNHAPYSVDLSAEGFPREQVRANLPLKKQNDEELLTKLGHYWYTDKVIGEFVENMEELYPKENLFMITGDHADRTNIEDTPTPFNRYTVPLIIYGDGINKELFADNVAGGHINIASTLFEIIAPKDFVYYSLGKSLTRGGNASFNDNYWINNIDGNMGQINGNEPESVKQYIKACRTISWWRIIKGNNLTENKTY